MEVMTQTESINNESYYVKYVAKYQKNNPDKMRQKSNRYYERLKNERPEVYQMKLAKANEQAKARYQKKKQAQLEATQPQTPGQE